MLRGTRDHVYRPASRWLLSHPAPFFIFTPIPPDQYFEKLAILKKVWHIMLDIERSFWVLQSLTQLISPSAMLFERKHREKVCFRNEKLTKTARETHYFDEASRPVELWFAWHSRDRHCIGICFSFWLFGEMHHNCYCYVAVYQSSSVKNYQICIAEVLRSGEDNRGSGGSPTVAPPRLVFFSTLADVWANYLFLKVRLKFHARRKRQGIWWKSQKGPLKTV